MKDTCRDLKEEYETLDAIVKDLDEAVWDKVTPFYGWSIRDEITHVAWADGIARLAATDAKAFARHVEEAFKDGVDAFFRKPLIEGRKMAIPQLLEWWRRERSSLLEALEPLDPKIKLPWYGPPMNARSFATARLMETWAHGQDVVDALGVDRPPTERLFHVAHLGVTTLGYSFSNRKLEVPDKPVRVELTSPSGKIWIWGPEGAEDIVNGSAEDFCLVVCQRRHVDDTRLVVKGPVAQKWMLIAQAFAGPPNTCLKPGMFPGK